MKNSHLRIPDRTSFDRRVAPSRYVIIFCLVFTLPFIYELVEVLSIWFFGWPYPWRTPGIVYLLLMYVPFIAVFLLIRSSNRLLRIYSWTILVICAWWLVEVLVFLYSGSCC